MDWTDAEAVAEVRLGNKHAFRILVERNTAAMFRLAFLMSGNEHDAEDLVQETFLRAYKYFHTFDGSKATVGTWLNRICANCSLSLIRARKNRNEQMTCGPDGAEHEKAETNWLDQIAATTPSPERLTQSGQLSASLGPALNMLTEAERTAFVLRHYEGAAMEEIALTLGLKPGAAKQTVFRAVQKLRTALEPAWGGARR